MPCPKRAKDLRQVQQQSQVRIEVAVFVCCLSRPTCQSHNPGPVMRPIYMIVVTQVKQVCLQKSSGPRKDEIMAQQPVYPVKQANQPV